MRKHEPKTIGLTASKSAGALIAVVMSAVLLTVFSGCGGGGELKPLLPVPMAEGAGDHVPPEDVYDLSAVHEDGVVTLNWKTVWNPEWKGVLIRRSPDGPPDDPYAPDSESDRIVYSGLIHTFSDTGIRHRTKYYYAAYSFDSVPNYSDPVFASATAVYEPFTFVVVPDTQYYTLGYPYLFANTMMGWVVKNKDTENIKILLHEGDITHKNTVSEWTNASEAFGVLEDGSVSYAFCPGNHDDTGGDTSRMNEYLPVTRYENSDTFGGVFEDGKMDNSYHLFSAGGTDWMVVALEYSPRDEALEWANDITAANPDRRVIVLTHSYLYINNTLGSAGENIWNNYTKQHENIIFVFNGHYLGADGARLVSTGDNGNKVYQMFANYQNLTFGGLGYMRLVKFDLDAKSVSVKTYSPYRDDFRDDDLNQFTFENMDFGPM